MAEQSSFDKFAAAPARPAPPPIEEVIAARERFGSVQKDSAETFVDLEEEHSSATSGADAERSSFEQESFDKGYQ
ncbi:hypothetical protein DXG03_008219, partial [Asterophora parasitica]